MNSMFNGHTVVTVFYTLEKASHYIPIQTQSVILSVAYREKACFSPGDENKTKQLKLLINIMN